MAEREVVISSNDLQVEVAQPSLNFAITPPTALGVTIGGEGVTVEFGSPTLVVEVAAPTLVFPTNAAGIPGPPGPAGPPPYSWVVASNLPVAPSTSGSLVCDAPPSWTAVGLWGFFGNPVLGTFRITAIEGDTIFFDNWTPSQ